MLTKRESKSYPEAGIVTVRSLGVNQDGKVVIDLTRSIMVYKIIFVMAVFCGAIFHLGAVLVFSDLMILSMAFPNIFGLLLLSPKVRRDLKDYWKRYKEGQFKTFK